jgi:hypothetical protein
MPNGDFISDEPSILSGVNEVIDSALDLKRIGKAPHHKHKESYLKLAKEPMKEFDASALIEEIYEKIGNNWDNSTYHKMSEENWRFEKKRGISNENDSPEVGLERAIINIPQELWPDAADWVNQVPTASGLVDPNADGSRRIDLVHKCGDKEYEFIEIIVGSDTPLYAAIEILKYGILYVFAREHAGASRYIKKQSELLEATNIHLRVLAPANYYAPYNLSWLEKSIDKGLTSFLSKRKHSLNLEMKFRFETLSLTLTRSSPWVPDGPKRTSP